MIAVLAVCAAVVFIAAVVLIMRVWHRKTKTR
jgi:hypothetical protein